MPRQEKSKFNLGNNFISLYHQRYGCIQDKLQHLWMADYDRQLHDEALKNYQQEVDDSNDAHAHYEIGRIYRWGYSSKGQDLMKAMEEFEIAASLGHPAARFWKWEFIGAENDSDQDKQGKLKFVPDGDQLIEDKVRDYLQCIIQAEEYSPATRELWTNCRFYPKWRNALKVITDQAKDIIDHPDNHSKDKMASSYMILAVVNLNITQYDKALTSDINDEDLPEYQQAKTYLESASQLGDERADYYLGWLIYRLTYGPILENTKRDYYIKKAAAGGHPIALYLSATFQSRYRYTIQQSLQLLERSKLKFKCIYYAKAIAQMVVYASHLNENDVYKGIHHEPKLIHEYLMKAYLSGQLYKHDYGGDGGAAFALGIIYSHGIGIGEKDYNKAAHFFMKNILGERCLYTYSSLYEIAKLIRKNRIVYKDSQLAELIYKRIIEDDQGLFCQGYYSLGQLYRQQQKLDQANDCFIKATNESTLDMYYRGKCYENGWGYDKSPKTALQCYRTQQCDMEYGWQRFPSYILTLYLGMKGLRIADRLKGSFDTDESQDEEDSNEGDKVVIVSVKDGDDQGDDDDDDDDDDDYTTISDSDDDFRGQVLSDLMNQIQANMAMQSETEESIDLFPDDN